MTPDKLVETVARAIFSNFRGDRPDINKMLWDQLSDANRRSFESDARSAILTTLEGIREATPEMYAAAYETGAIPVDKLKRILHNMSGGTHSPAPQPVWHAMLDRLIADVKGPPHG